MVYTNLLVSCFIIKKKKKSQAVLVYILCSSEIWNLWQIESKRLPQLCWATGPEQGNNSAFLILKWHLLGFYALKGMPYNERNGMSSLYKLQVFLFNVNCFFFQSLPNFSPTQLLNLLLQGGVSVASYPGPPGPPVSVTRNLFSSS